MSTTTNIQVRKGLPYQVRVRADGKWDFTGNQTFTTAGQEYFATMETYDGLFMDYIESYQSADKVDFSNTVLPWKWQYSTALSTNRYCLMPAGQNYDNVKSGQYVTDYTVVGSPTISSDYVVSGFSTSNYLKLQNPFNPQSSPWEMGVKVYITQSTEGYIFQSCSGTGGAGRFGPILAFYNHKFEFQGSTDNANWDIPVAGDTVMADNAYCWVKFGWTGTEYYLDYSTDGETYIRDATYTSSTKVYTPLVNTYIGVYSSSSMEEPFQGSIDLKNSYIKINGDMWWIGADAVKETLPGCTYNFTDDGSATTLNCFAVNGDESVVLTPDNSYGTSRLLGTVSIPSHTVYEYNNGTWTEKE